MKDVNSVRLAGEIFWSKLDDRQTYSLLNLGVKLLDGASIFCTVNNPSKKDYEIVKPGNKVIITNGYLDTWEKKDGTTQEQIKVSDAGIGFYGKEKALSSFNNVTIVGKVLNVSGDSATIEMIGDRNPKTDKPTVRKVKVRIGEAYDASIIGSKIMLEAKLISTEIEGKSKMSIEAFYDKITIL